MRFLSGLSVGALALSVVGSSYAGPDWIEDGDAGSSLVTAQPITNVPGGQVRHIIGSLSAGGSSAGEGVDYEDIYQFYISEPTKFLLSTAPEYGGSSTFQTSLWLFDAEGFGQLGNVYSPQSAPDLGANAGAILGSTLFNFATDNTEFVITKPGVYYVAITGIPNHPLASGATQGQDIFSFAQFDEISGPDGAAGTSFPFLKWWYGAGETGSYDIRVEGVSQLPAPGALSLLLCGFACGRSRKRRN